ncbi:unnamed protein product [Sphenostylis stenocarpa]|uniref:Uncharacterized protein n=1 Tax=Sphenostylis stenocarpa TaxID=92480 RepID=A0AA86VYY1_9FABA|nr:unnamed protein product [Sphenostylis stenocarpa]
MYRVLLHLNIACIECMEGFTLSLTKDYDAYHINQWISALLNRGVKELSIESNRNLEISTHSLWKSQSLQKLVLDRNACGLRMNVNACAVKVPPLVCISSLTVLKLTGINVYFPRSDGPNI